MIVSLSTSRMYGSVMSASEKIKIIDIIVGLKNNKRNKKKKSFQKAQDIELPYSLIHLQS